MTRFRGCIDIHSGQVKQIVGGSLRGDDTSATSGSVSTNFTSSLPSSYYSQLYSDNSVYGTHVIKLGSNPENDAAALEALKQWPGKLQIGGGINSENAEYWIKNGASHVIVTSYLFPNNEFSLDRLTQLRDAVGSDRIVIDLSCRKKLDSEGNAKWYVTTNKWQTMTEFELNSVNFRLLEPYCDEFLVHAADVEGLCQGIDEQLVQNLSEWVPCNRPVTYAGGAKEVSDLQLVEKLSGGVVDLTFGSALDIFGGSGVKFEDVVKWNDAHPVRC